MGFLSKIGKVTLFMMLYLTIILWLISIGSLLVGFGVHQELPAAWIIGVVFISIGLLASLCSFAFKFEKYNDEYASDLRLCCFKSKVINV